VGSLPTKKTMTALVNDLAHPCIFHASSGDGVLKSTDAGTSWQTMNTGLRETQVVALAINPAQPTSLYAASASVQIFHSTDGATTWQRQGQLPTE
jgi:photosystem II stability/assembly factor-like uncharacterized protein